MTVKPTTFKDFMTDFNGHANSYASFMLIGKNITAQKVFDILTEMNPYICAGSGYERRTSKGEKVVGFEICKECPELIYDLTKKLQCTGYADIDWDETYFIAAQNGKDYDNYTAKWEAHNPECREDDCWDAFIKVKDPSGAVFHTGVGAVETDIMEYFRDIVKHH